MASAPARKPLADNAVFGIMAKLRSTNEYNHTLMDRIKQSIALIEGVILADPKNEALHHLLLKTYETHKRGKAVCQWEGVETIYDEETGEEVVVKDKKGNPKKITIKEERYIWDNENWQVQIVRGGKAVRVCVSENYAKELKETYGHHPNFKVYE